MSVRPATVSDYPAWLALARQVEYLFGPMADEPSFQQGLLQAISEKTAFCIASPEPAGEQPLDGGIVISTDTNEILWRFQANGAIGGISVYDHVLIFGTDTADEQQSSPPSVYCLSDQGSLLWKYDATGNFDTHPTITNEKIYIGNDQGSIYCFQFPTGEIIWSQSQSNNAVSSPLIVEKRVVYESLDGNVYCLDAETGDLLWDTPISNDIISNHVISDGKVYVGNHCLNLYTGSIIWTSSIGLQFLSSISYQDDRLYVGSQDEKFYCLDANTGEKIWKSKS